MGDELEGNNSLFTTEDEDEEEIHIELNQIPDYIHKIAICVSIYDASAKNQNFGMVY